MATSVTEVRLSLKAEFNDLKKALKESSDLTDKEVTKMVNRVEARYKSMEKAAKKTFQGQSKEAGESFGKVRELGKSTASYLGGTYGALGGVFFELGEKVAGVAGSLGAMGGAAVGVAGGLAIVAGGAAILGKQLYDITDAAKEARNRLDEAGLAALIPEESRNAIADFEESQVRLNNALDRLHVILSSEVADDFAKLLDYTTSAIDLFISLKDEVFATGNAMLSIAKNQIPLLGAGLSLLSGTWAAITAQLDEHAAKMDEINDKYNPKVVQDYDEELQAQLKSLGLLVDEEEEVAERKSKAEEKKRKAIEATRKAEAEAEKQLREQESAIKQLEAIADNYHDSMLTGLDAINDKYDEEIARIAELEQTSGNAAKAEEARKQVELARAKEVHDFKMNAVKEEEAARESLNDQIAEWDQAIRDQTQANFDMLLGMTEQFYSASYELASSFIDANLENREREVEGARNALDRMLEDRDRIADRIQHTDNEEVKARLQLRLADKQSDIQTQRQLLKERKQSARKAFQIQKAAEIANAGIQGAILALTASAPPPAGLGPIGGPIFASLTTAAAIAKIATTKPPKFHRGGLVSGREEEQLAVLRNGESVLNQRATESLGSSIVEALNNGNFQGGAQEAVVNVYLDGKLIARQIESLMGSKPKGRRNIY